ncbi:hypothetical protein F5Y10DRAFT_242974 [Nemania abortiva]|nr:hypothetical protein F5Y10DRAFT_242974 [Nemania abortiva]
MLSSLINVVNDIALGPEKRKVRKYLDEATCASVLADLENVLSPRGRRLVQTTFDKYCIEDLSQQKYWNEESFRKHVRDTHSALAISDSAIRVLWRSFHFYAYHPFPRDLQDASVDFEAFRRAVLLTVFRCDGLLGTRELDWFWRNDAVFFRRASFERIFRSIGTPEDMAGTEPLEKKSDMTSTVSDAMDVLIMVGPQFIHAAPSPAQLEAVARRLVAEGPVVERRIVRRKDISTLMSLLQRIKLKEGNRGSFYNPGSISETNQTDEALTEAVVKSLTGDQSGEDVTLDQLRGSTDLMPELQLQFHQLWAILF